MNIHSPAQSSVKRKRRKPITTTDGMKPKANQQNKAKKPKEYKRRNK